MKGQIKMKKTIAMAVVVAGAFSFALLGDDETPPAQGGETPQQEVVTIESHVDLDKLIAGTGPSYYEAGESVTNIRNYAFAECRQIEIVRADLAQTVGIAAFRGCVNLKEVNLPLVTTIAQSSAMFAGCISLVNVYLPQMDLTAAKAAGFPWQTPARAVVFHFKDGDYDKNGRKL